MSDSKTVDGKSVGNLPDEILYRLTEDPPEGLEVIESAYQGDQLGAEAYARVVFQGRVFRVSVRFDDLGC